MRPCDGLVSGRGPKLAEDAAHVRLHGVLRDVQSRADLALREPAGQEPEYGQFALGELVARCGWSSGSATRWVMFAVVQYPSEAS